MSKIPNYLGKHYAEGIGQEQYMPGKVFIALITLIRSQSQMLSAQERAQLIELGWNYQNMLAAYRNDSQGDRPNIEKHWKWLTDYLQDIQELLQSRNNN